MNAAELEQMKREDPERYAALMAGYERAAHFAKVTQHAGAPMSFGHGKPPEGKKK